MKPGSSGANSTPAGYRRLLPAGQEHVERRAAAHAILEPSATPVELGEAPHERESHTDPRRVRRRRPGRLAERLEHGLVELGRDPASFVLDDQHYAAVPPEPAHP